MNYLEIIEIISNGILQHFDEVYHSAEIVTIKNDKFPAIVKEDEWITLVPTDQRETLYIRRNGDDEVMGDAKIASCTKGYRMRSSLRIVFFRDHADKHNEILKKLMQTVLIGGTKLKSIIRDKRKLQKDESSGQYNFGPRTAYFAIDIYALWDLSPDTCEDDFCTELENPLRKCLVVENES